MLCYCEKCGGLSVLDFDICVQCGSHNSFKMVPNEYVDDYTIKDSLQEQFVENIVKSSPNFDPICWNRREAGQKINERNEELLKNDKIKQSNVPKCPTCNSTNIEKISLTKKAFGGAMFGLFSSDVRNMMHCKSCGYKW